MKKELLAPAGDIEAGYAALYYGADAVYLGLKQFSARANAGNFSTEELGEFASFAHHLGRKVFVTINTVLQQAELSDLLKNLDICRQAKVDALIIQDLGVAHIVKQHYPEFEMHASTQMAVHNKAGAMALKNLGFSRVVVARELSLSEIKDIATIPDLELEAFIHGALCYSYSGICQFSSLINGRSANRGKCAYPCRAEFAKNDKLEHCFSMKDMALQEDILKLPVYSLKIEGRKKSALYVAAVTDYYRNILNGNGDNLAKAQNIKQIFSRPWCKFHFASRNKEVTDTQFVGHRGLAIGKISAINGHNITLTTAYKIARHDGIQIDIEGQEKPFGFSLQKFRVNRRPVWEANAGDEVEIWLPEKPFGLKIGSTIYLASSSEVKGAYTYQKPKAREFMPRFPIDVNLAITSTTIVAQSGDKKAELTGNFTPAQNPDKMTEAIQTSFAKTGDTELELHTLHINNPQNLFVPVSMLNDLRRRLYEQITPQSDAICLTSPQPRPLPLSPKWIIKTDRADNLSLIDLNKIDEVIFLISPQTTLDEVIKLPKNKVRIALPAVCRKTSDFEQIINRLLDSGYKKWEIANYWGLSALPIKKIDLSFDNLIYMFNQEAIQMAKEMRASRVTLAIEDTLPNLENLSFTTPLPISMVVYQDAPLFTSAVCIRDNNCKDCDRKPQWISLQKDGLTYQALSQNCQLMMFADKAFCAIEQAPKIRADFYRADFCYKKYSPTDVKNIFAKLTNFTAPNNCFSGNLTRRNEMF